MSDKNKQTAESFIVSFSFNADKNKSIMLVGQRKDGKMEIINAIKGEKAHDIYNELTTITDYKSVDPNKAAQEIIKKINEERSHLKQFPNT